MPDPVGVTDLTAVPDQWSAETGQLRARVVALTAGQALAAHVNQEADVVLVGVAGRGSVLVDGEAHPLGPSSLLIIPKGAHRELRASAEEDLRVLVVHRRTAVSGPWRWRARRRRPWEDDPWEDER